MLFTRFATLLATSIATANAISVRYCSNENTGTSHDTGDNLYNSLGACTAKCQGSSYSYAIVQNRGCWCSNDAPSNMQSPTGCSQPCPGYPANMCGNEEKGLFGYVEIQPSGSSAPCTNNSTSMASTTPTVSANLSFTATTTAGAAATTTPSSTLSASPAAYTGAADKMAAWGLGNLAFGVVLGGAVVFGI